MINVLLLKELQHTLMLVKKNLKGGGSGQSTFITAVYPFNVEALDHDTVAASVSFCEADRIFLLHCICKLNITSRQMPPTKE